MRSSIICYSSHQKSPIEKKLPVYNSIHRQSIQIKCGLVDRKFRYVFIVIPYLPQEYMYLAFVEVHLVDMTLILLILIYNLANLLSFVNIKYAKKVNYILFQETQQSKNYHQICLKLQNMSFLYILYHLVKKNSNNFRFFFYLTILSYLYRELSV